MGLPPPKAEANEPGGKDGGTPAPGGKLAEDGEAEADDGELLEEVGESAP
jgi:hypothetical protein